jgi:hypothetical protein
VRASPPWRTLALVRLDGRVAIFRHDPVHANVKSSCRYSEVSLTGPSSGGGAGSSLCASVASYRPACPPGASIAVVLGFERAGEGQAEIVCLRGAECGQLDAELVEVEGGDLHVEVLGQDVDLVVVFAVVGP